jgi:adenylate cyclase
VEIQRALALRNAAAPEDQQIILRIGISQGDVIVDGEDLYGNGVNVAARMEGLAEAGGICVSGNVQEHVGNSLDVSVEDLGEQTVKNIDTPVRCYRVHLESGGAPRVHDRAPDGALPLPDKPSIAVLPFANMSGDPGQEHFCDGMTDEIITALSKISDMFVIARSSAFSYKGRAVKVEDVARELGVRYVLEGSVRTAGNLVRITGQLVDTASAHHLWAERYERELTDIFELQDEITQEVVTALQVRLTEGEQARLRRRQTRDVGAWECFARSQEHLRRFNKEDNLVARALLEQALERDPNFPAAWSHLAWTHLVDGRLGFSTSAQVSLEQGAAFAAKSLDLDDTDPDAHAVLGAMRLFQRRYDEAEAECRKAVAFGPNVAEALVWLAVVLAYTKRGQEALGLIEKAMRYSPFYPDWYLGIQGVIFRVLGRFDEAIQSDRERLSRNPDQTLSNFRLAALYSETGQAALARDQIAESPKEERPCLAPSSSRFRALPR